MFSLRSEPYSEADPGTAYGEILTSKRVQAALTPASQPRHVFRMYRSSVYSNHRPAGFYHESN
jgi:hypothetical protein